MLARFEVIGSLTERGTDGVGEVPVGELGLGHMGEVVALAGDGAVDDAHAVAATHEGFGEVRADEAGAAGHKVVGHTCSYLSKNRARTEGRAGGPGSGARRPRRPR